VDSSRRREDLVRLLRRRRNATTDELARDLGVSVRTVFRDLDAVRARGFAIDGTVGRGGGVQLDPASVLLTAQLGSEEIMSLLLSVALLRAAPWLPFAAKAQDAVAKVERVLPPENLRELRRLLERVLIGEPAPEATLAGVGAVDPRLLEAFERCFHEGRVLGFRYTDRAGRATSRKVEPHGLLLRAPLWYVIAWDPMRDAPRLFRMDRIRRPVTHTEAFQPRPVRAFAEVCAAASPLRRPWTFRA